MKKYLLIICMLIAISCQKKASVKETNIENSTLPKNENRIVETISEKNTDIESVQNIDRPKQSEIIKSKYDSKLLFGIWTYDPKGPHADFELTKKSFYVVDYDGDGDMPYIINQDTIRVYYNDYVSVGIIKNATKDTLKIDWDESGITNYVKWKG
ncbi:hypothetical protein [Flavobacterium crassostreae]|uniref:Lipocalin-like domain-containing protein n=1 Tax=Flavobacterium crassostreae TaxID=1763534 RepID=A0A1B9EA83_9FLAO|nr:hypothetical protein [Flavobacterium crassostreae]EKT3967338.1 hypothetical protein [Flavobacterium psychrophilum]OCB78856.1 hypothetical protein LPBF_00275 [Flavobacterium crassostreae]